METWAFWGGFLAVLAVLAAVFLILRSKLRRFSRRVFGKADLLKALAEVDSVGQDTPRSLNGCDTLLLPQILRDFPDFDAGLVKTYARDALGKKLGHLEDFTVYNVVIAQYLPTAAQKTVVLQAAVSYREQGKRLHKRYCLHYAYLVSGSTRTVAANCPNCGGAMGYGETTCPYCGSRVANVLGNCWEFTEIREG